MIAHSGWAVAVAVALLEGMATMPLSYRFGQHFESFLRHLIASGRYASASEVMRDGLRLLEQREHRREARLGTLRHAIQEGFDSGPALPLDMDGVRAEARSRQVEKIAARA